MRLGATYGKQGKCFCGKSIQTPPERSKNGDERVRGCKVARMPLPFLAAFPIDTTKNYEIIAVASLTTLVKPSPESTYSGARARWRRARNSDLTPGLELEPLPTTTPAGLAAQSSTHRTPCGTWPSGSRAARPPRRCEGPEL
jgi:hypothetical protein